MKVFFYSVLDIVRGAFADAVAWLVKHSEYSHALIAALAVLVSGFVLAPIVTAGASLPIVGASLAVLGAYLHWIGAAYVIAYYHGREKRDAELATGLPIRLNWYRSIIPWNRDFRFPLVSAITVALIVQIVRQLA